MFYCSSFVPETCKLFTSCPTAARSFLVKVEVPSQYSCPGHNAAFRFSQHVVAEYVMAKQRRHGIFLWTARVHRDVGHGAGVAEDICKCFSRIRSI